jgi:hypothetical protein
VVKTSDSCPSHGLKVLDRGLEGFVGSLAPTARHPLYDLYRLTPFVLNCVSYVEEAPIAAVGVLLVKAVLDDLL